jgi:hypothetical protein
MLTDLGARLEPVERAALVGRLNNQLDAEAAPTVILGPMGNPAALRAIRPALERSAARVLVLCQPADVLDELGDILQTRRASILHTPLRPGDTAQPWLQGIGPAELHFRARTDVLGVLPSDGFALSTGLIAACDVGRSRWMFCQVDPRQFDHTQQNREYLKLTENRTRTLLSRVLAGAGVPLESPLVEFWTTPTGPDGEDEPRWLRSYYLDPLEATDDPYRYKRW